MTDLCGQRAVVTGGTRGIGAGISRALLEAGAEVHATYHKNSDAAGAFVDACTQQQRGRLHTAAFDVSDAEAVAGFFKGLPSGGLQILVNNSGVRQDSLLGLMSLAAWERVLAVNLGGVFHMCKHAVRAMMSSRYGRIVNITSPSGRFGFAGQANYAASKAGLEGLTRSLAREVATRSITVNCVSPGFILTDLIRDLPEKLLAKMKQDVPMKRFGEPEEVAAAVLFLVSRQASYVNGAVLEVTGGI